MQDDYLHEDIFQLPESTVICGREKISNNKLQQAVVANGTYH